ncbi:glycosyltransferase family 4 protein [bacterium]|nr:glycosyltransferase family 4 protein [bacterium]
MKVIHVPRRYVKEIWGGTESVIHNLVKFQKLLNIDSKVLTSMIFSKKKRELINGVEVHRFSYFYPWFGLKKDKKIAMDQKGGNLFSFSLLWALLTEKKLDLIHLHTQNRLGGIARFIAKLRKIPYVVSVHGGILNMPVYIKNSHQENY